MELACSLIFGVLKVHASFHHIFKESIGKFTNKKVYIKMLKTAIKIICPCQTITAG